ncbi:hypothetical protein LINGRAHAP2_LOCUS16435, partial [Linum grandiflorum]
KNRFLLRLSRLQSSLPECFVRNPRSQSFSIPTRTSRSNLNDNAASSSWTLLRHQHSCSGGSCDGVFHWSRIWQLEA